MSSFSNPHYMYLFEMKNGKKKLAIFYGAAHCPDLEKRLLAQGYTRKGESWVTAWDLSDDE